MIKNKNLKHMGKVASIVGIAALAVSCAPTDNLGTSIYKSGYTYDNEYNKNYRADSYITKDNITKTNLTNTMRNYDYTKSNAYDMSTYKDYKKDVTTDYYKGYSTDYKYPVGSDTYNNMNRLQTNISSSMGKTYNNTDNYVGTKTGNIKRTVEGVAPTKNTYTYEYSSAKDIARYNDYMDNTNSYSYRDTADLLHNAPTNYMTNTVDNMNYRVTNTDYTTTDAKYDAPKYSVYGNKTTTTIKNKSDSMMNKVAKDVEMMTE